MKSPEAPKVIPTRELTVLFLKIFFLISILTTVRECSYDHQLADQNFPFPALLEVFASMGEGEEISFPKVLDASEHDGLKLATSITDPPFVESLSIDGGVDSRNKVGTDTFQLFRFGTNTWEITTLASDTRALFDTAAAREAMRQNVRQALTGQRTHINIGVNFVTVPVNMSAADHLLLEQYKIIPHDVNPTDCWMGASFEGHFFGQAKPSWMGRINIFPTFQVRGSDSNAEQTDHPSTTDYSSTIFKQADTSFSSRIDDNFVMFDPDDSNQVKIIPANVIQTIVQNCVPKTNP